MSFNGKRRKETALENPLVIRTIFECLSTKQLVRISRVNKLWNYEARCILRDERKCMAIIDGDRPCLKAKKLDRILPSLNVNFFNGLSITLENHETVSSLIRQTVQDGYENLVKMPWKYLEIQWSREMPKHRECLLGQFIMRLMVKSSTLEHLIIKDMPLGIPLKGANIPQGELELPKLKTLQVTEEEFRPFVTGWLPSLLARAPNVELRNAIFLHWIPRMPLDKLKAITKLHIPYEYSQDSDGATIRLLDTFLASEPKLRALSANAPRFPDRSPRMEQDFFARLAAVIYSSSETLREVKLESFVAYMLCVSVRARLFPPVLKNVKDLTFEIYKGKKPGIVRYLMRALLAQMFPDLVSLTISTCSDITQSRNNVEPNDNEMSQWPSIKHVRLQGSGYTDVAIMELKNIFPNLRCLEICLDEPGTQYFPFRQIWSSLQLLEELTISGKLKGNFDAEFCGIYPQEATLLRREDNEYLRTVNIVPLFSPVAHVRGLKVIHVELETKAFFLSKVAVLMAVTQLPNLEFRLRAPSKAADQLEHLKPYVKMDLQETE